MVDDGELVKGNIWGAVCELVVFDNNFRARALASAEDDGRFCADGIRSGAATVGVALKAELARAKFRAQKKARSHRDDT